MITRRPTPTPPALGLTRIPPQRAQPPLGAQEGARGPAHLTPQPPRLLDRVRAAARVRHLSPRTEQAYVGWIRRFILFHGKRHPDTMGEREVTAFLSALATVRQVSASTQSQALAALLFLYANVLGHQLPWMTEVVRAKRPERLPIVLTRAEVRAILQRLEVDTPVGLVASRRASSMCATERAARIAEP